MIKKPDWSIFGKKPEPARPWPKHKPETWYRPRPWYKTTVKKLFWRSRAGRYAFQAMVEASMRGE